MEESITPLIDADILLHELGWSGEFIDREKELDDPDRNVLLPFDHVQELLDAKIKLICDEVEATEPPILFITDSEWLNAKRNKQRKFRGEESVEFIPNFRYEVSKSKPYKGTRKNPKPYHFYNILAHLMSEYDVHIGQDGYEADDELCMFQIANRGVKDTIICSRDKDLRICPGWHYSWECGKQRSLGPTFTDRLGWLQQWNGKTIGYGMTLFYYQMLVGDVADNIPGCPGRVGDKTALKIIKKGMSEEELLKVVKDTYKSKGANKEYFMEQANLLWMVQKRGKGYG